MQVIEKEVRLPNAERDHDLFGFLSQAVGGRLRHDERVVRFVITESDERHCHCELGVLQEAPPGVGRSVFDFERRAAEHVDQFNVVLLVPTGVGAKIGGHAGDATPVARLLAGACDTLITHPNVVNASDLNELPENGLYVEGSVVTRLLMGTIGLARVRSNRVLLAVASDEGSFVNGAINAAGAARAVLGLECPQVIRLPRTFSMKACYAQSGCAVGEVHGLENLCEVLDTHRGQFDALAICSYIDLPHDLVLEYFQSDGDVVNPWGGVEAMLTHSISHLYDIPSAHSPMSLKEHIGGQIDQNIVDCRMAAESVSLAYLHCVLKGLHRSPRIVTSPETMLDPRVMTCKDVSCLVIPDRCLGLPTLAALAQRIPVIAVRENRNLMKNDLTRLPWAEEQIRVVDNYLEAAGVLVAMRAGVAVPAVRRPLAPTRVADLSQGPCPDQVASSTRSVVGQVRG